MWHWPAVMLHATSSEYEVARKVYIYIYTYTYSLLCGPQLTGEAHTDARIVGTFSVDIRVLDTKRLRRSGCTLQAC